MLSGQIHALLDLTRPTAPANFCRALDALLLDRQQTLTRRQASLLLRAVKLLPNDARLPECQQMLRNALYDLTRAVRAEAMLHEQIARHADRERSNALPGSERSVSTGGMLGMRFGLPAGAHADVAAGGLRVDSTSVYDDSTVATACTATLQAAASAQATVAPGLGVHATISGHTSEADLGISLSMQAHVVRLGHASVARRLGGNALQRAFKRITNPRRDRYDERTSRALAWQSRLPMLLGRQAVPHPQAQPLAFSRRGVLIDARMTTHSGSFEVGAGYGIVRLDGAGNATRLELHAALPVRVTELDEDGRPAASDPRIHAALEARISALVSGQKPAEGAALQQLQTLLDHPRQPHHMARRLDAAARVGAAFDHLQVLCDLKLRAPRQAAPPLASLLREWGAPTGDVECAMINMLDTLAWLQVTPEPPTGNAHDEWTRLQCTVQGEARRIHDTPLPHDRQRVYRATHAFRDQTQRIASTGFTASVLVDVPGIGASVEVGVTRSVRNDPDPLRDGTYLELTFAAQASLSIGPLLSEVQRQFPEFGALPVDDLEALLAPLAAGAGATGSARASVRFFRPSFQDDVGFPASARGYRLYMARLIAGASVALDLTVPVPVLPGISPTFNVKHARSNFSTLLERLGAGTVTSLLLRYRSLCSETMTADQAWVALQATHGADLDRLVEALTVADSVPAEEARFWLQHARSDTATLDAFSRKAGHDQRRAQLRALFDAVGHATSAHKTTSPLLGALTLPDIA